MKPVLALLLVGSAAMAAPAYDPDADLGASASLTGLRLELLDLSPGDDVAPSLQITGVAWAHATRTFSCVGDCRDARGEPFGAQLQASPPEPNHHAYHAMATITSTSLEAIGWGSYAESDAFAGFSRIAGDPSAARPLLRLGPNTALRITGHYELDAFVSQVDPSLYARAGVWAWGADAGATSAHVGADNRETGVLHDGAMGTFEASWSNPLGVPRNVWGGINVAASGFVRDVPEPGTAALLLLGLVVLAGVGRRSVATQLLTSQRT
jgi:hypothetical protein